MRWQSVGPRKVIRHRKVQKHQSSGDHYSKYIHELLNPTQGTSHQSTEALEEGRSAQGMTACMLQANEAVIVLLSQKICASVVVVVPKLWPPSGERLSIVV